MMSIFKLYVNPSILYGWIDAFDEKHVRCIYIANSCKRYIKSTIYTWDVFIGPTITIELHSI